MAREYKLDELEAEFGAMGKSIADNFKAVGGVDSIVFEDEAPASTPTQSNGTEDPFLALGKAVKYLLNTEVGVNRWDPAWISERLKVILEEKKFLE